jgi:hypothetical protein
MPITTYLPSKLGTEVTRFKQASGNTKLDYRSATGSAPYLFSTPYVNSGINNILNVMSPLVPTTEHVTGDNTNYRRFSTDVGFVSDDYQRNVVLLHLKGSLISVFYKKTIFNKFTSNGVTVKEATHYFELTNQPAENLQYYSLQHLILSGEEVEEGFVDKQKIVKLKLDTSFVFTLASVGTDTEDQKRCILLRETVTTDYGEDDSVVDPALISKKIKDLKYFSGSTGEVDNSFTTNVIYGSSFVKTGNIFSTTNNNVLSDSNPNFYLYSKSVNYDQNVIGYSFNISPNRGSMLHLVDQSDNKSYIYSPDETLIGRSSTYYGTEFTGFVSSPFLLLNFDFTSQTDTFKIKIGNEDEVVLGDYTAATFKFLCAKLSDILYEKGILVIPCKNNRVAFDRFLGEDTVDFVLTSLYTKLTTVPKFTSFEYLSSTKTVQYNPDLHPVNFTFTYVDQIITSSEPVDYPLTYKLSISKDTGRATNYTSYKVRLKFDINSVRNTTQSFKLEVEEGTLDTTFTINDTDSIDTVLDMIGDAINNFLPSNYSVEKSYLASSIDIINNQATESTYIKVTTGPWMTIDPLFGGVYVENPDGSKTIVIKPNDGSSTITNDTGMLAFNAMYASEHIFGVTSLNPVTGSFSQVNYLTATVGGQSPGSDYCYSLNELNTKFREYGYEAIPLFTSTTSGVHYYIGLTRIVNSASQTKLAIGVTNKADAYNNKFYISGKDLYRISDQNGTRVKNTKGNASIEAWKDKVVPSPNALQARPFEITETTTSLYKTELTGSIANRDGMKMSTVCQNGYFNLLLTETLNPISDPAATVVSLVNIITGLPNGWTPKTSVNGTVYSAERVGDAIVTLDTATMKITVKFTRNARFFYCNSIGFDQENDLVIDNYAGWVKYPYGYNTNQSNYGILEVKPYIYMLITAYHADIDGA